MPLRKESNSQYHELHLQVIRTLYPFKLTIGDWLQFLFFVKFNILAENSKGKKKSHYVMQ